MKKSKINILLLCNPCNGFGDIVFAMKLMKYITDWYKCNVKIATTDPSSFEKLGAKKSNIIPLMTKKVSQCRRFGGTTPEVQIGIFDLYIVAPLPSDLSVRQRDISKLIPHATSENTIFFSEYNDNLNKGFHFNTGIGGKRDGIFLTEIPHSKNIYKSLDIYAVAYLAESIKNSHSCFFSFLNMVSMKYRMKKFTVVAPKWVAQLGITRFRRAIDPYYKTIAIEQDDKPVQTAIEHPVFIIKCNVFPVPNKKMLTLMKYSVEDILLTGDQSITDALSCCPNKNIFYQIAPWKENFAKQLTKELPNPYLGKKRSSCGTIEAVHYKSDYTDFIKKWDFRKLGKPKLDSIIENL